MCIAYISLGQPGWPLLIAANRDEFHARPASMLGPWPDQPNIIAGRDLQAGGTWFGWSKTKRFAFITNYREPLHTSPANAPSRGQLVTDYLNSNLSPEQYSANIVKNLGKWAGFNLLIGDMHQSWYLTNRNYKNELKPHEFPASFTGTQPENAALKLKPGNYVISNHLLDTPWPKSVRLKRGLNAIQAASWVQTPEQVFDLLHDTTKAATDDLPNTGIGQEFEYLLSSPFIISDNYGTRCSSLMAINDKGHGLFSEISFNETGQAIARNDWPV